MTEPTPVDNATWSLENRVMELEAALVSVLDDLRDRASMSRGERVLPLSSGTYLKVMKALGN